MTENWAPSEVFEILKTLEERLRGYHWWPPLPVASAVLTQLVGRPIRQRHEHGTTYNARSPAMEAVIDNALNEMFEKANLGRASRQRKRKAPSMTLLDYDATLSTVAIHYLRQEGGGRMSTDAAIDLLHSWQDFTDDPIDERTFRHRLQRLREQRIIPSPKR